MTKEDILQAIENMTVLELAELVKALEEKFGVSAAAPASHGNAGAGSAAPAEEERLRLTSSSYRREKEDQRDQSCPRTDQSRLEGSQRLG